MAGAVQASVAPLSTGVLVSPVGALGRPITVTDELAVDAAPVPAALVAVTVNVYAVPAVRPVTVHCNAPVDQVHCPPPGLDVAVYAVIVAPPLLEGAVHETVAWFVPAVAVTPVG